MIRNLLYSEGVGASLTEPRQKRVTQRVYHAVIWKLQIVHQRVWNSRIEARLCPSELAVV